MQTVIIIGAGPAGLTAAHTLLKASQEYEVIILEESEQIGGISRTVQYHGNRMDIGGHRFFSKDERVMQWWEKLMPLQGAEAYDDKVLGRVKELSAGGPNPEEEDRVMLLRQRISRIYYQKKFFDYPISLKPQTFINMGFVQTIKAGFGYLGSVVHKRKEESLEDFYINRFGRVLYSMFFEGYTEKLWGRHPSEISADWGAQRVKGLSISAIIKDVFAKLFGKKNSQQAETSLIEEFWYPKYGPGQLWECAADEVVRMGGRLIKQARVDKVQFPDENHAVVEYMDISENSAGVRKQLTGNLVISSMPLKDLAHSMGEIVPEPVRAIAQGLPYRDFVTVGLLLSELSLENRTKIKTLQNIVPDCWIYVQDTGVKLGRIQIFNNWSPYMVADPEHQVWIGLEYFCKEDDGFWNLSDEESTEFAIRELIQMGILDSKDKVLDSHREKVKKAYPAYFDTYLQIDALIQYLNKIPNLYCIGRNGQHRYNNMDHSMATAFEAAESILKNETNKESIWNVNTEKSYHEAKESGEV